MTNDQIEWTDAERDALVRALDAEDCLCGAEACESLPDFVLRTLAPHVAAREAQTWEEGFEAGHQSARAVNPEFPRQPRNPYRRNT